MRDDGKYIRLFGTLFFTFIGFIVAAFLTLLLLRVFFGILSFIPGLQFVFTLLIITVPAALFMSVFLIYVRRTKSHPSQTVKIISFLLFAAFIAAWLYFFVLDMIIFFKHFSATIGDYHSYDMIFLVANVLCLFVVGMIQALAVKKEADWMDRKRDF